MITEAVSNTRDANTLYFPFPSLLKPLSLKIVSIYQISLIGIYGIDNFIQSCLQKIMFNYKNTVMYIKI